MKKAFTLAEILIVLIIIGVVSLLTVPALVDLYKFRDLTARYHRIRAELTTAFTQAAATANYSDGTVTDKIYDHDEDEYYTVDVPGGYYATIYGHFYSSTAYRAQQARKKLLENYLGARKCQQNGGSFDPTVGDCFAKTYEAVKDPNNGEQPTLGEFNAATVFIWPSIGRTSWGASFMLYSPSASGCRPHCVINYTKTEKVLDDEGKYTTKSTVKVHDSYTDGMPYPTYIFVDTNGRKGPNVTGYDAFIFQVAEDGSLTDIIGTNGKPESSINCGQSGRVSSSSTNNLIQNYKGLRGCVTRVEENGGRVVKFKED